MELIKLHNHLGQARYRMSLSEQKMFIYAVRQIDQEASTFEDVSFRLLDFANAAGLNIKHLYREIDDMTTNIMKTVIIRERDDGKKGFEKYNLTQKCDYKEGEGILTFRFNDEMKPLLLQLQNHYFLQNPAAIEFKSWHSIRIYDLLKSESFKYTKDYTVQLDSFKAILNVDKKYARFNNLRMKVIDPAVAEINEKSDLIVEWEPITQGKKVIAIKFKMQVKRDIKFDVIEILWDDEREQQLIEEAGIEAENFSPNQIWELYTIAGNNCGNGHPGEYIRLNYLKALPMKNVKNRYGYLKRSVAEDFARARDKQKLVDESNVEPTNVKESV